VYINLVLLVPRLTKKNFWIGYTSIILLVITLFTWLNLLFFSKWSNTVLPDYFFISYFDFFQIAIVFIVYISITTLIKLSKSWFRVNTLQKELLVAEKQKSIREKEMMELEAKALRAQMNPHFIFNCLNSIKSLIQEDEKAKSVTYLTTFSKLIRTLFNNADKKEISLYDEIETCKYYLQLESMRFDTKFSYTIALEENIDLKSVQVPALIIQPFIENAIWHGIVPQGARGHILLKIVKEDEAVQIVIDDNGIGREASQQNKPANSLAHQSKGVTLTQSRLELNNLLQQRHAKLETIDKKDDNGAATGTTVIIKIREEQP
jgi:LytS/YehU family sensor histidine kinase